MNKEARAALIKLASSLPQGSDERKTILSSLSTSKEAAFNPLLARMDAALQIMSSPSTSASAERLARVFRIGLKDYADDRQQIQLLQQQLKQRIESKTNTQARMRSIILKFMQDNPDLDPDSLKSLKEVAEWLDP